MISTPCQDGYPGKIIVIPQESIVVGRDAKHAADAKVADAKVIYNTMIVGSEKGKGKVIVIATVRDQAQASMDDPGTLGERRLGFQVVGSQKAKKEQSDEVEFFCFHNQLKFI
jgi:hypothetical protein